MRTILVGLLVLLIGTCSAWCTRFHAHEGGLHHHVGATTPGDAGADAEGPRPVNDDNCACAGALPGFAAASMSSSPLAPLPLDHPFAFAAAWLDPAFVGTSGTPSPLDPRLAGDPFAPAVRAARLRC